MLADGGASQGLPAWLTVVAVLGITGLSAIAAAWIRLITRPGYLLNYVLSRVRRDDGSWKANIYLSGRGRHDITSEAFDNNQPIEFDNGAPIRKLTGVVSSHATRPIVEHHAEGTRLLIGPGLIGRRQDLRFTVITDRQPKGIVWQPSLIDFQVRPPFIVDMPPRLRWMLASGCVSMAYLIAAAILLGSLGINQLVQAVAIVIGFVPIGIWILYRRIPPPLE
jgi:hypothetical protein